MYHKILEHGRIIARKKYMVEWIRIHLMLRIINNIEENLNGGKIIQSKKKHNQNQKQNKDPETTKIIKNKTITCIMIAIKIHEVRRDCRF